MICAPLVTVVLLPVLQRLENGLNPSSQPVEAPRH
jgi:hypothetical protein